MLQKLKNWTWSQIFIIYTRYLVGSAFVFASIVKIQGKRFTTDSGADHPIDSAWHYFEVMYESGIYWQFIGWGQLIAGMLLMTQRFSKLGAVVFLPIISNIWMVTISYGFKGTWIITSLMLLANLLLIVWHSDELKSFFNLKPDYPEKDRLENLQIWQWLGVLLFLFTISVKFQLTGSSLLLWFVSGVVLGLGGFIWGLRQWRVLVNR